MTLLLRYEYGSMHCSMYRRRRRGQERRELELTTVFSFDYREIRLDDEAVDLKALGLRLRLRRAEARRLRHNSLCSFCLCWNVCRQ